MRSHPTERTGWSSALALAFSPSRARAFEMSQSFRVAFETKEDKQRRIDAQKKNKEFRQAKLERTRYKGAQDDVELVNIFLQFGINPLYVSKEEAFKTLPTILTGRKFALAPNAINFLTDQYGDRISMATDFNGKTEVTFHEEKRKDENMSLISEVAEKSGQKRRVVKEVYEAMLSVIRVSLKNDRYIRLPDLCRIKVSYRPAKEKRKGMNPFTGKKQWFKARPASNKLRFSPLKAMKTYVAAKVEVVAPVKKKKKSKKD
jgi:DNA-binding protein HU-beta